MRVLVRLNRNDEEWDSMTAEERRQELYSLTKTIYEWSSDDDEAYLCDSIGECVFGFEEPERLRNVVREWNPGIIGDFRFALEAIMQEERVNGTIQIDSSASYEMKKAAMALDGDFYPFAGKATCLGEAQNYFSTYVKPTELEEIMMDPSDFAMIEVYPKC